MQKIFLITILVILCFQNINSSSLVNKNEQHLQPTTQFEEDTNVKLNFFETHKTKSLWKDEIEEMGSVFLMLYEEWSEPCAKTIPKFDRSSQLNKDPKLVYAAVNCKNARAFCILLNCRQFPTIYYIKDYEHFYLYNSHQSHQFYLSFIQDSHKNVPHTNISIMQDHRKKQKQMQEQTVSDFQKEILHISMKNFTYLKHPNQFIIFYTPTNSYTQQILPLVQELHKENLLDKNKQSTFAAVNVADDNASMSVAFKIQRYPFMIYTFDENKYAVYDKPIDKDDIRQFYKEGYREAYNNAKKNMSGNILEIVDELQKLHDVGKKAEEYQKKTSKAKNYQERQEIIKEIHKEEVKETEFQQQMREAKAAAREQAKKRNEEISKKRREQQKREDL